MRSSGHFLTFFKFFFNKAINGPILFHDHEELLVVDLLNLIRFLRFPENVDNVFGGDGNSDLILQHGPIPLESRLTDTVGRLNDHLVQLFFENHILSADRRNYIDVVVVELT